MGVRGHEKFIPVWIKRTRWKPKKKRKKKGLHFKNFHKILFIVSKFLPIFHEFSSEDLKKRSSFQKFYEIRCEFSKITKILAVNTNSGVLGLDLHSSSPKPVNFFGAQSSLGGRGHNFRLGGTSSHLRRHGPEMPPPRWPRACLFCIMIHDENFHLLFFCFYPSTCKNCGKLN